MRHKRWTHEDGTAMKRVLSMAGSVVVSVAAVSIAALALAVFSGAYHLTPVLSGSMRPQFDAGAVVVTERIDSSEVGVGDVIVFFAPGDQQRTVHRVIEATASEAGTVVRTRGDANNTDDPWRARLSGHAYRVITDVPWMGHAAIALRSHANGVVLFGLAALCAIGAVRAVEPEVRFGRRRLPAQ